MSGWQCRDCPVKGWCAWCLALAAAIREVHAQELFSIDADVEADHIRTMAPEEILERAQRLISPGST